MPVMDGLQATKEIRELENSPDSTGAKTAIVALTAAVEERDSDTKDQYDCKGFDDFAGKPLSKNAFDSIIRRYVK